MVSITARIDNTTEIQPEYRAEIVPIPKSVKIELTSQCNFQCGFCSHANTNNHCAMDKDEYKRIVKELADAGVEELGLFYIGESMMVPWLPEAISYAKEVGIPYVFLTTNGSLATPDKVKAIMEAGLDSLKFSFNNSDAEQFRKVVGIAPRWYAKIIHNIKEAKRVRDEGGYKTKLYASSIKYDGDQQERMQSAVNEIITSLDEHYWLPLYSFGAQATENEKALGMKPGAGNPGRLEAMRPPLPCWAVFKEGHITSGGKMSACCFDSADKWAMADLTKTSFVDGWNSEEYQKLRKAHLNMDVHGTACEECIHGM
jgi:MoaA/NifB/PqqE/SkfB family radical SAM enzyme